MKIQPDMTKPQRPTFLAISSEPADLHVRARHNSETDSNTDSGVGQISKHSSLESIGSISQQSSGNTSDNAQVSGDSSSPIGSLTRVASSLAKESSYQQTVTNPVTKRTWSNIGSEETVTKERVLRDEQSRLQEKPNVQVIKSQEVADVQFTFSEPFQTFKSGPGNTSGIGIIPKLVACPASTPKYRPTPLYEFVLCKRHGLSSEYFCSTCSSDGCYKCMAERHANHKQYESVTCYHLLIQVESVCDLAYKSSQSLARIRGNLENFQKTVLCGVCAWQEKLGICEGKLGQIQADFDHHKNELDSIHFQIHNEFTLFKKMSSGLIRLYQSGSLIEVHHNANPVRRSFFNLQSMTIRATEAISSAILTETGGRNALSEIIRSSGMEILTHTSLANLEKQDCLWEGSIKSPPIFQSPPDTRAPEIPSVLSTIFHGRGVPSPTICDSFNFARMDPIARASARTPDGIWPAVQDQMQMAQVDAVSQLLCPEPPVYPEVNNLNRRWERRTPQPMPSTSTSPWFPQTPQPRPPRFADYYAEPPLQRSRSLVAMWEGMKQLGPSVPPLVPLPSSARHQRQPQAQQPQAHRPFAGADGRVFEIGYHTVRNYSQIKTPVLILEGQHPNDPATLCRPWGICHDGKKFFYLADRSNDRICCYTTDGTFVRSFGSKGDRPGEFNRPAGVAIDNQGRIIIADKDNHRVQVFSPDGEYLFSFGRYGNQNGEFFYPWDVACSPDGKFIAVTDTRNHRVQIFTSSGEFIRKISGDLDSPRGVVFISNDELLVTDFNNHNIKKITLSEPFKMVQFNKVIEGDSTTVLCRPQGLTLDGEGNVLACDSKNDRVAVFSPAGNFTGDFGKHGKEDGQFDRTVDVAVAPDGKTAVVDLHNNRVQIF